MVPAKTHQFRTRLVEVQLPSESCWVMSTGIAGVREYPKSRDISWYFMIFHDISWYVSIFHDMSVYFMISMVSWYFMAVKRWCCCHRTQRLRPRPTEVPVPSESWTCRTWGYPKSSKSRPFWHWIPWWFGDPPEAKLAFSASKSPPRIEAGCSDRTSGGCGSYFFGANKDLLVLL